MTRHLCAWAWPSIAFVLAMAGIWWIDLALKIWATCAVVSMAGMWVLHAYLAQSCRELLKEIKGPSAAAAEVDLLLRSLGDDPTGEF